MRKRVLVVFGAAVTQKLSVFVMTMAAARMIGAEEFGKFAIVYATCVNLTGFIGDGLAATVNRHLPMAKAQATSAQYEVAGMLMSFCYLLAAVLCLLMLITAPVLSHVISGKTDLASYVRISSLITLFLLPNTVAGALLNSFEKALPAAICSAVGALMAVSLGLSGAIYHGAFGMCVGFAIGTMLQTLMYFFLIKRYFSTTFVHIKYLKMFFKSGIFPSFTFPTMATMALGGPIHWLCMSFLGSSPSGIRQIAIFSALFQWYTILTFIPASLMNFTVPWLAKVKSEREGKFREYALKILLANVAIGAGLLALVLVFQKHILALYGPDFADESEVLVLLATCGLVAALVTVMNQILWASGKTWSNLLTASVYGATYVAATFVLIKVFNQGVVGLVWAILIACMVQGVIQAKFSFFPSSK